MAAHVSLEKPAWLGATQGSVSDRIVKRKVEGAVCWLLWWMPFAPTNSTGPFPGTAPTQCKHHAAGHPRSAARRLRKRRRLGLPGREDLGQGGALCLAPFRQQAGVVGGAAPTVGPGAHGCRIPLDRILLAPHAPERECSRRRQPFRRGRTAIGQVGPLLQRLVRLVGTQQIPSVVPGDGPVLRAAVGDQRQRALIELIA